MIESRNVWLEYAPRNALGKGPSVLALRSVNIRIEKGEFAAIVGPSGCGKTSFLKIVAGLIRSTRGEVIVDGKRVDQPLKNVGMVFQNPVLLPWRNVLQNVLLPLEIVKPYRDNYRNSHKKYAERAMDLLELVGLSGFAEKMPWELSGGMQQRASLCRALIHEPEILLLDEPFGALDLFTREELWLVLQELWMRAKCTTIMVTHDLREALFLAQRVYVMSARPGTVIEIVDVPYEYPRALELTYTADFAEKMKHLRSRIVA